VSGGTRRRISIFIVALSIVGTTLVMPATASETWRRVSTQSALATPPFLDVSCPTAHFCAAATSGPDDNAIAATAVDDSWTVTDFGAGSTELLSVSCASPTFCAAVGTSIRMWNGQQWMLAPITPPGNPHFWLLTSVSCTSATFCVAAGSLYTAADGVMFFEHWDGTQWHYVAGPAVPTGTSVNLQGVSCVSVASCVAVGAGSPSQGTAFLITARWDGASWSLIPAPSAPAGVSGLTDVSCTSTMCMAVGATMQSGVQVPYAAVLQGTTWTVTKPLASLEDFARTLNAVSCIAPTLCITVAIAERASGGSPDVIERWNGSTWSNESTPWDGTSSEGLFSVSCQPRSCVAVGTAVNPVTSTVQSVILRRS
jgi:hypothetical protein